MKKIVSLIIFWQSYAWALSPKEVVQASLQHYPKVIEAVLEVEKLDNKLQASRGQFDGKIKGEVDSRTEGFYTGDHYKAQLEKPIPYFNSSVYGGLRQSFGSFPDYEGKSVTGDQGEAFIGLSLSLLRDSLIDGRRGKIKMVEQERNQAQLKLEQTKINIQTLALQTYWNWVISGFEMRVYQDILALAEKRAKQISKRIKAGDLARIYASENNQYIQKRKAQVLQSKAQFNEQALFLSLFYRDTQGQPVLVKKTQLPEMANQNLRSILNGGSWVERALDRNLQLKVLASQTRQAQVQRRLGVNQILPKLDVNLEWNQDQGQAPTSIQGDENRIMLQLEVPIEYRKGLGKKRAAENKLNQLKAKTRLTADKTRAKLNQLIVKINAQVEIFDISKTQIQLAEKLAKAEIRKFKEGASDLILVNIREENLAEARIKNLQSFLKYQMLDAELKRATIQFL